MRQENRRPTPIASDRPSGVAALVSVHRYRDALTCFFNLSRDQRNDPSVQLWAATAAARLGRFTAAHTLATAAELGFRKQGGSPDEPRALNLLGALALERGDLVAAERRFRDLLAKDHAGSDRVIYAHATTNLGSIMDFRGQPDGALRLYYEGLRHYQAAEDARGLGQIYHNLSLVYRKLGMPEAAESVARLAVRNAERSGEPALLASCLSVQAEVRMDRNDLTGAAHCVDRAQAYANASGDEMCQAATGRVAAQLHLRQDRPGDAIAAAEISRSIAHRCGSPLVAAECAAVSAIGLRRVGRKHEARERRKEATQSFVSLEADWLRNHYQQAWNEACVPRSEQQTGRAR